MRFLIRETESGKEKVKLSVKDKKLLQLLIQDSRMSITQLAKKIGISKPAITQKIESLKKRGIWLDYHLHTRPAVFDTDMYVFDISTQLGMTTKEMNIELLKLKETIGVLWYNSPYNLIMAVKTSEPGEVIDKISEILEIKKFRIRRVKDNWFHPMHLFKEIPDKHIEFTNTKAKIDETDKKILNYLYGNPNTTFAEMSEKTKLSPITIKKRLLELEKNKTISAFSGFVDPWLCGKEVVGISLIVKGKKETEKLIKHLLQVPQTSNIWEFYNEWNVNFVLWVDNQADVNKILNSVHSNFKILDTEISVLAAMIGK
ncbi:Lrp/AsnC family transcriptional regulator [Candidatus Pacearchaeota archaeon]|nr:Lrp/AsnC family transcriptional regulator [Candidatus Pacearchaeota archaeon]